MVKLIVVYATVRGAVGAATEVIAGPVPGVYGFDEGSASVVGA